MEDNDYILIPETYFEDVKDYLTKESESQGIFIKSSYFAALKHARELTGRSLKTGKPLKKYDKNKGNWAGACIYLILIDHIGQMFAFEENILERNDFLKALKTFTNLSDQDSKILYQLRNSFLHQFNLYQKPKDFKRYENRHFSVSTGGPLIEKPDKSWNGDFSSLSDKNTTRINLVELANLVDNIHLVLLEKLESGELKIRNTEDIHMFLNSNRISYRK